MPSRLCSLTLSAEIHSPSAGSLITELNHINILNVTHIPGGVIYYYAEELDSILGIGQTYGTKKKLSTCIIISASLYVYI